MIKIEGQIVLSKLVKIGHVFSSVEVPVAGSAESAQFLLVIKYKVAVGVAPALLGEIIELDLAKLRVLDHFLILMVVNGNHFRGKCCMR